MNTFKDPYGILTIVGAKELLEDNEEVKVGFLFNVEVNVNDDYFKSRIVSPFELNNCQLKNVSEKFSIFN